MFKSTSMRASKSKILTDQQLLQFALAEFSSSIEMLHAAKLSNNIKLSAGFINHALDEYKHANFFLKLLSASPLTNLRFDPRQTISGGFIRPDRFLFERMQLIDFTAFIAVNEANALRIFTSIKDTIGNIDTETSITLDKIIEDETEHLATMIEGTKKPNHIIETALYEELLADEKRHVAFSSKFLEKSQFRMRVGFAKTKSRIGNKIRHFWAAQHKIQNSVDKLISGLTIALLRPLKSVLILPDSSRNDLFSIKTCRNML
jgi:hypothetical protein